MKTLARFSGGLGLILFLFGTIASLLFVGTYRFFGYGQMVLGIAGIVFYLLYFVQDTLSAISRKREAIFGILGGLLILFILVGLNVVAHSKFGEKRFDWTTNKIHSLAPESKALLRGLKDDVTVMGFLSPGSRERANLQDWMDKYTYESGKLKFEMIDPDLQPTLLKEFDARNEQVGFRNEATKKTIVLDLNTSPINEQEITGALKRVLTNQKTIYFAKGHGEADLEDDKSSTGFALTKDLMQKEGFVASAFDFSAGIPKEANIVVLWGAQSAYTKSEADQILGFLNRGGQVVIGLEPFLAPSKDRLLPNGLEPVLERYGLELQKAVVLEKQLHLLQGQIISTQVMATQFGDHPIVSQLKGRDRTEFAMAMPILQSSSYKGQAKRSTLISTSENSWPETDLGALFLKRQATNQNKKQGSPVGQIVEWDVSKDVKDSLNKKGRLVVFGDADFASLNGIAVGANRDLFLNTLNYLGGEETTLSIRPRLLTASTLEVDLPQRRLIYYLSLFVIPQLISMAGVALWLSRRYRTA